MNETMQQIMSACVPVLCLLITAGGAYAVRAFEVAAYLLDLGVDPCVEVSVNLIEGRHGRVAEDCQCFVLGL